MAVNYTTSFNINIDDLQFILQQIKIAEASSIGYTSAPVSILQAIMDAYGATAEAAALLPAGLRTVDGTFNNLLIAPTATSPGTSAFGAADTLFPRLTDPVFIGDATGTIDFDGAGPGPAITQGNYGVLADANPGLPGNQPGVGSVVDTAPRIISNLIVDMSVNNPAAIAAYLSNPLSLEQFEADHAGMTAVAPVDIDTPQKLADWVAAHPGQTPLAISNTDLQTMPNLSPDIGLSPGFNAWMTYFGQFFDHGLDLVTKGSNGTVYIPLQPDDPLYVEGSLTNFMALTRATVTLDANGVPQHENTTTSWIDQNQTYTSHSSHQVFLREYVRTGNSTVATGRLLDGTAASGSSAGAIGNWGEVKAQAREMLGIILTDFDVHNVPLLLTDQYGKFIPGANGYAQVATAIGFVEGTAAGLVLPANTVRTNHAFLNDIAHHAAPGRWDSNGDGRVTAADAFQVADTDPGTTDDGLANTYDDEMLNSHFITGDGRGNENIALTSVHSIFHSEHNRAVEVNKATLLANAADVTLNAVEHANAVVFLNEWLLADVAANSTAGQIAALTPANLVWDGERLFQAARFSTENQYQHMVFEEFARRIQPFVDPFIFTNTAEIDPSIVAEFAHTVYRFGHSMLTGTVDRLDNTLVNPVTGDTTQDTLLAVFLNPQAYTAGGVDSATINANLIRGLTRDVGNAMDEFIVTDVRSNLLGLPLDLAALNIARGRDTGIPSLNETRAQLYAATGLADLTPYTSWADFAANIKNPMSIVNFIAAYGTHASIVAATTVDGMRDAAMQLVFGGVGAPADRLDFLNATGTFAGGDLGGMNNIDLWIGGLAEAHPEFGGMLGTTFNYVFEYQMESLQNGDRLYYLSRTQGLNFLNRLEPNTFADMVMRNTELGDIYSTHLNGFLFVTPDHFIELDRGIAQTDYDAGAGIDPLWAIGEAHTLLTPLKVTRSYTGATTTVDAETGITHDVGGTLKFFGGEHVVVGGTEGDDKIWTDKGIDTLWGDGGNDYLNAGTESDNVFGGEGDDIIEDPFGDDLLRGNQGNDVISSARGLDIMFGDQGQDYIMLGQDASEVFAGQDDDFILGGAGTDALLGNEGNDWIEGGDQLDSLSGENSQLFFNSTVIGHDVLNGQGNDTDYDGESGDDIMVQGAGIQRNNGMFGFDWGIHKNDSVAADSDLGIPIFAAQAAFTLRDRFDSVEGLSGWVKDDILTGATILKGGAAGFGVGPGNPADESDLKSQNVSLIDGLAELLGATQAAINTFAYNTSVIDITQGAEIIIGGGGSDTVKGNLGNDMLDGDAWLNVRIKIVQGGVTYSAESMSTDTLAMGQFAGKVFNTFADGTPDFGSPAFGGATLNSLMLNGTINPGSLSIVREILQSTTAATDVDTAVYNGLFAEYTITRNPNGSLRVAHTTPVVAGGGGALADDGVDIVRNFEFLQFADGVHATTEFIVPTPSANIAPVITSNGGGATAAISHAENSTAVTIVTARDANNVIGDPLFGQALAFSISGGADAAGFSINPTTGELSFVAAPNFEAPVDAGANNVYEVAVQVSDGTLVDTQALAVTVTNVVGEVLAITSLAAVSVAENTSVVDAVSVATDGATLAYSLSTALAANNADAASFSIHPTTGVLSFVAAPNFEAPADVGVDNVYNVVVQVSDGVGGIATQARAITVTNVNEAATGALSITSFVDNNTSANLTATNTIADPDVVPALVPNYQWQSLVGGVFTDIAGATAATLDNQTNTTVRVTSSYTDPFGTNSFVSTETAIVGSNGVNIIEGVAGNEYMLGLDGNDTLKASAGNDTVNGGAGTDTYDLSATNTSATVNLAIGTSTSGTTGTDTLAAIENVTGSSAADTLTGDAGANTLDGGAGNDAMAGGAGNDAYVVDNTGDVVVEAAGGGTDQVNSSITYNLGAGSNVENLTLTGTAAINGIGNELNNNIVGNTGNNAMSGGAGTDTITGGAGQDTLTGGAGKDVFVIAATADSGTTAATSDIITDFATVNGATLVNSDVINLSAIDAIAGGADQAFTFIGTADFTAAGQLRYVQIGADTFIQGNIDAGLGADFSIQLSGLHVLGTADFVL